jgi:hypothetical protein
MDISIRFTPQMVKMLIGRLQRAYRLGDLRVVRRISALLALAKKTTITEVAETYSIAKQTVYEWVKALMCYGEDSLVCRKSPGRKSRRSRASWGSMSQIRPNLLPLYDVRIIFSRSIDKN